MAHENLLSSVRRKAGPACLSEVSPGCPAADCADRSPRSKTGLAPEPENWSVTLDLAGSLPVLDDELTIIETYLGTVLDEFLSDLC
jgi:hypothetical protein